MSDALDPDTLADKLFARFKRAAPADDGDDGDDGGGNDRGTLKARVRQLVDEKKQLRKTVDELASEVGTYKESAAKAVQAAKEQAAKEVKALREEYDRKLAEVQQEAQLDIGLVEHGLNDGLGRKAVRDAYMALPEKERPASPLDYLRTLDQAHKARVEYLSQDKADPTKAPPPVALPRNLVGYLADRYKDPEPVQPKGKADPASVDTGTKRGAPKGMAEILADPELRKNPKALEQAVAALEKAAG